MAQRVTQANLQAIVDRINRMTQSPATTYERDASGKLKANIGNYHLDGAYGGWKLGRVCTEGGGTQDVLRCGYVSKPELQRLLFAYICGLEAV